MPIFHSAHVQERTLSTIKSALRFWAKQSVLHLGNIKDTMITGLKEQHPMKDSSLRLRPRLFLGGMAAAVTSPETSRLKATDQVRILFQQNQICHEPQAEVRSAKMSSTIPLNPQK
jgi:hypothetical protein